MIRRNLINDEGVMCIYLDCFDLKMFELRVQTLCIFYKTKGLMFYELKSSPYCMLCEQYTENVCAV